MSTRLTRLCGSFKACGVPQDERELSGIEPVASPPRVTDWWTAMIVIPSRIVLAYSYPHISSLGPNMWFHPLHPPMFLGDVMMFNVNGLKHIKTLNPINWPWGMAWIMLPFQEEVANVVIPLAPLVEINSLISSRDQTSNLLVTAYCIRLRVPTHISWLYHFFSTVIPHNIQSNISVISTGVTITSTSPLVLMGLLIYSFNKCWLSLIFYSYVGLPEGKSCTAGSWMNHYFSCWNVSWYLRWPLQRRSLKRIAILSTLATIAPELIGENRSPSKEIAFVWVRKWNTHYESLWYIMDIPIERPFEKYRG